MQTARRDATSAPSVSRERRTPSGGIDRIRESTRDRIGARRADSVVRVGAIDRSERVRVAGTELRQRTTLTPRLDSYARRHGTRASVRGVDRIHRDYDRRPHIVYRDRPGLISHRPHHVYSYRDRYDRLCSRIIWPRYHYPVYYRWGPYVHYRHVYPYYHRKYVFVSLGGWWPWDYTYTRYYWYGWHPYTWYGYYPVPREVEAGTHNYYTYNYYTGDESVAASQDVLPYGIDAETLGKVQQRVAEQQVAEPAAQTQADTYFENGVTSFEAGRYAEAAMAFAAAMELSPEDRILPFAYAQAMFANKQYSDSAKVLRMALQNVSPEEQGVFYPRGLYANDDALFGQIEELLGKAEDYGFDADLQLLLGYHLLGIGETEYARAPLEQAGRDQRNAQAAKVLLALLNKIEAAGAEGAGAAPQMPADGLGGVSSVPETSVGGASPAPSVSGTARTDVLKRMEAASTANHDTGVSLDSAPAKKEDDDTQSLQNVDSAAPVR